ncbi:MAG: hypothetical protein R2809_14715 [Flavobacteriales bacterium]
MVKEAEVGASLGLLFKVAYPIWMYIGAGASYNPVYEEITEYSSNGSVYEVVWMRNSDQTQFGFYPEAGLILKVGNALTLKVSWAACCAMEKWCCSSGWVFSFD